MEKFRSDGVEVLRSGDEGGRHGKGESGGLLESLEERVTEVREGGWWEGGLRHHESLPSRARKEPETTTPASAPTPHPIHQKTTKVISRTQVAIPQLIPHIATTAIAFPVSPGPTPTVATIHAANSTNPSVQKFLSVAFATNFRTHAGSFVGER